MFRITHLLLLLSVVPGLSCAMEDLNEESLEIVSAEGLAHMFPAPAAGLTAVSKDAFAALGEASTSITDQQAPPAPVDLNDHVLPRRESGQQRVELSQGARTNDATVLKVADISIQVDSSKDLTTSSGDSDALRMNLSTRIDSIAAMNARHSPSDLGSRGSYFVEQMQVNSTVTINTER